MVLHEFFINDFLLNETIKDYFINGKFQKLSDLESVNCVDFNKKLLPNYEASKPIEISQEKNIESS